MMTTVVAIDLGASSGRVLRGVFDGERLAIEECSRFPNGPVAVPGPRRVGDSGSGGVGPASCTRSGDEAGVAYEWDILALWRGILDGLREASLRGAVDAIGIDTWAVDYGLLDEGGRLIGNPASYRSARCGRGASEVLGRWDSSWLYARNGLQFQPFNTLFQRVADRAERRADCARTALLIPDLLAYWLTGQARSELTSDQVPLEMYANDPVWAGTPATADAVSCDPTATTGVRCPVKVRRSRPSTWASPMTSPGEMIGGKSCSTPKSSRSLLRMSGSQSRSAALTRPVVDAFVSSLRA